MRLNASNKLGTAGKADIDGYFVGGKTGTANKNFHGHYDPTKVFTTFMAVAPADKPKYLFMTIMDETQAVQDPDSMYCYFKNIQFEVLSVMDTKRW